MKSSIIEISQMKKRLGLFVFYDEDGIVDDYVIYLIEGLKSVLQTIIVAVNGNITEEGVQKLQKVADRIIIRENIGLDFGAWKQVLTKEFNQNDLLEYDELLLINDSCFGPIRPFAEVFQEMDEKEVDFWGLTIHGAAKQSFEGPFPEHIQSYFIVIREKMLHSVEFLKFWEKFDFESSYDDIVKNGETKFTEYFKNKGFSYSSYINTKTWDSKDGSVVMDQSFTASWLCLLEGSPLIKRKVLTSPLSRYAQSVYFSIGDDALFAFQHIKENTDYPIQLIWQHLLRKMNIADVRDTFHLDYVIPEDLQNNGFSTNKQHQALAVIHLAYKESIFRLKNYILQIPEEIDILITTISDEMKALIEQELESIGTRLHVIVMENRGRDIAALLVAARETILKYPIFSFTHDKLGGKRPISLDYYWERSNWDNLLHSKTHVNNILNIFEDEPYLGVLAPPCYPKLNNIVVNYWSAVNFQNVRFLLNDLGIRVPLSTQKSILTIGTSFYARTEALMPLLQKEWKHEDFPEEPLPDDGTISHAIERSFAYIAQSQGYYTASVYTDDYARLELASYRDFALNNNVKNNTEYSNLIKQNMELNKAYQEISNAAWWKLTEPGRTVLHRLKQLKKRINR